jgi:hypothetical protein
MTTRYQLAPTAVSPPPPVTPALNSLLASATQINDDVRWTLGIEYWPENCVVANAWWPGCDVVSDSSPYQVGGPAGGGATIGAEPTNITRQIYLPPEFESSFGCSSTGWQSVDYPGRAKRQVTNSLSNALEAEFWSGTLVPENYNLVGNCPLALSSTGGVLNATVSELFVPVKPQDALAMLTGALASCGAGAQGMIHAPSQIVELWAETQALNVDGPRLRTKSRGNIVVSGGGYPGTGPASLNATGYSGQISGVPGQMWVYASDMVVVRVDEPTVTPDTLAEAFVIDPVTGRKTNHISFDGHQVAAAYCGTCCTFAVLVDTSGGT